MALTITTRCILRALKPELRTFPLARGMGPLGRVHHVAKTSFTSTGRMCSRLITPTLKGRLNSSGALPGVQTQRVFASSFAQSGHEVQVLELEIPKHPAGKAQDSSLVLSDADYLFAKILDPQDPFDWRSMDKSSLVTLKNSEGFSILHVAVEQGDKALVEKLLPIFDPTGATYAVDVRGRNLLHIAALNGHSHLISLLSDRIMADDASSRDKEGYLPIHLAIIHNHPETLKALVVEGGSSLTAVWHSPNGEVFYPASLAIALGSPEVLEMLLALDTHHEIDLCQPIPGIGSSLHLAILNNEAPMLKYVLRDQHTASSTLLEIKDSFGKTPLQLAAFLGDLSAIEVLYESGAKLNYGENSHQGTAVHQAMLGGHKEAIQMLDFLGADLSLEDSEGTTPRALARKLKGPRFISCAATLERLASLSRAEKSRPPVFTRRPPHNLVFRGGGPRGIAYIGAIRAMEARNLIGSVKRVAGTSAGAITATFLAIGYNTSSLEHLLSENLLDLLDFRGGLEKSLMEVIHKPSKTSAFGVLKGLLGDFWTGWKTFVDPVKRAEEFKQKLRTMTGLCDGDKIRFWIDAEIEKQTGKKYCTFKELNDCRKRNPDRFKDLHIFSLALRDKASSLEHFCYSNEGDWNDLVISDAVRASMSIPGVFKPHTLHFKSSSGTRYARVDHGEFIDGGLIKNFPVDAFDGYEYQDAPNRYGENTNRRTLGFNLATRKEEDWKRLIETENPKELIKALIGTYFYAEDIILRSKTFNASRTVTIPVNMGMLDFDADSDQKLKAVENGFSAVEEFLRT